MHDVLAQRCWTRALANLELEGALGDCSRALRLAPRSANVLDSRGLVHLRLNQIDAAIDDYTAALTMNSKIAWSLYGRGLAKLRKGLKADGEADIAAAVSIQPQLPDRAKRYGITAEP
jgi:tetratricopeptide (TPR) repeat protein